MAHWRTFLDDEARAGRYLPWREVARTTGLSRTTAWRLQKRDDFPAPYAISPGRVGYREEEVEARCVSRGHSGPRARPSLDVRIDAATAAPSSGPAARIARQAAGTAESVSGLHPSGTLPRSLPRVQPRSPRRRRSQHAQAIAQQMLFDF
jgi:predicted DNA-binding transcriptional regulator AlpA